MSKELHKAILKRSILRNISLKHRADTNKKTTALKEVPVKNTKNPYFENLDTKNITDNRSFWRTVLPLFTQN